jgi:hypothetical protein
MTDDPLNLAHGWAEQLNEGGPVPSLEDWCSVIAFVLTGIAYTLRRLASDAEEKVTTAAGNGQ